MTFYFKCYHNGYHKYIMPITEILQMGAAFRNSVHLIVKVDTGLLQNAQVDFLNVHTDEDKRENFGFDY